MRVREFWLTNANGDRYDLMQRKTFAHDPQGLGFGVDISTLRLGNSDLIISEQYSLGSFASELVFMGKRNEVYQNYKEFLDFIAIKPILLHYRTPNTNESYRCNVRVVSLNKTEMSDDTNTLNVPISLYRQSMWYGDTLNVIDATKSSELGKSYPLERPYHYGQTSISNIKLYNDGMVDAPLKIEVIGASTDMTYNLYDAEKIKYGSGKILGSYDRIVINGDDIDQYITLERGGSNIPNAINYQDLTVGSELQTYITFLKLKTGQSTLTFNLDDQFEGLIRISWRNAYVSV